MGLFSNVVGAFTGSGGASASGKAGRQQTRAIGEGIEEQRGTTSQIQDLLSPFANLAAPQFNPLQQGATVGGFAQNIQDILQDGALDPLIAERKLDVRNILGEQGLGRSGVAVEELSAIPTEMAFNLENQLRGRQQGLFDTGMGATTNIANQLQTGSRNIQDLLLGRGQAQAGATLGAEQARGQGVQNIFGALGGFAGAGGVPGIQSLFSDKRMKKDIEPTVEIKGVKLYNFKPNDLGDKYGMKMTKGVIADELKQTHPHLVSEKQGYLAVDYNGLIDYLEAA